MIPIILNNDHNRIVGKAEPTERGGLSITFADDFVCTTKMFREMFNCGYYVTDAVYKWPDDVYSILKAEIPCFNVKPECLIEDKDLKSECLIEDKDMPSDDASVARRIWNAIRRKKHRRIVIMDNTNPSGFRLVLSYKATLDEYDSRNNIGTFSADTALYVIERAVKKFNSEKPLGGWEYS